MDSVPKNDIFNAVRREDFPEVKIFVEIRNVSVNCLNYEKETPVHIAAHTGNLPILKYLVNVDKRVLNVTDGWGQSVLHVAAERGFLEMVKFLVEDHKMDVYKQNKIFSGNAPIHLAASTGSVELLKYFVEDRGMDPNILNTLGQPPVFLAAQNVHLNAVKYLYEDRNANVLIIDRENKTILHMSAIRADLIVPKYLMDEKKLKFDVNLRDSLGNTVVCWGSRRRRMDFMKYFVEEKRADINIQNNDGWTPFHQAVNVHNKELIQYLYEHGANIQLKDKEGNVARNVTDDADLHEFIDKLGQTPRNRRSVFQPITISHERMREHAYHSPRLEAVEDSVDIASQANINALQLNSFLLLANIYFQYRRCSARSGYRQARPQLNPREISLEKLDPLVTDAINYNTF